MYGQCTGSTQAIMNCVCTGSTWTVTYSERAVYGQFVSSLRAVTYSDRDVYELALGVVYRRLWAVSRPFQKNKKAVDGWCMRIVLSCQCMDCSWVVSLGVRVV